MILPRISSVSVVAIWPSSYPSSRSPRDAGREKNNVIATRHIARITPSPGFNAHCFAARASSCSPSQRFCCRSSRHGAPADVPAYRRPARGSLPDNTPSGAPPIPHSTSTSLSGIQAVSECRDVAARNGKHAYAQFGLSRDDLLMTRFC